MVNVTTLSELYKKDSEGFLPVLFEIYNPDIAWTDEEKEAYAQDDCYVRFINDDMKVKYKGKVYLPCVFNYQMPETDGSKIGSASVSISALDVRVRRVMRSIKLESDFKVIGVFAKVNLEENGSVSYAFKELNTITYRMSTASANKATATFNLAFNHSLNVNVPIDVATQDKVPGTEG